MRGIGKDGIRVFKRFLDLLFPPAHPTMVYENMIVPSIFATANFESGWVNTSKIWGIDTRLRGKGEIVKSQALLRTTRLK